jgi:hypothetical protein
MLSRASTRSTSRLCVECVREHGAAYAKLLGNLRAREPITLTLEDFRRQRDGIALEHGLPRAHLESDGQRMLIPTDGYY